VTTVPTRFQDLFRLNPLPDDLALYGTGVHLGQRLEGWRGRSLRLTEPKTPLETLPWPLSRPFRSQQTFKDCTFADISIEEFDPGAARFEECNFVDVEFHSSLPVRCHLIRCRFVGTWNANIWADTHPFDTLRRTQIQDNDFSALSGIGFLGGVPIDGNVFDERGSQRLLQVNSPTWAAVRSRAAEDTYLAMVVSSLEGRGPLWFGQDWCILNRSDVSGSTWRTLQAILPS